MNRSLIGIILTVIAVILGIFILRPKITDVRAITIQKKAKTQIVKNKEARKDGLVALADTFANQPDKINALISALPQEPQIPEVLVTIETMTHENGVNFDSISPQVDTAQHAVAVSLNGTASLDSIERLLRAIADNSRPMSVSSLSLSKGENPSALIYSVVVTFPYISDDTDAAASNGSNGTESTATEGS